MPSHVIERSFCTTREAATLLGVSVGTAQLWVESGILQAWKTAGGHRRISRESVERLLHKSGTSPMAQVPAELTPAAKASGPERLRVLVVEDDPNLLRLYQSQMARWPFHPDVMAISNAIAALIMIGRRAPDLLVTDLHMPGLDGFGMLRVLRNDPAIANTRIVVVTGLDAGEIDRRGGLPEGVEVLPKPIPFRRLQDIALALVHSGSYLTTA
jgi:excisionase family DNA binding protein